jgi:tyrosyl-tRNA synthetase
MTLSEELSWRGFLSQTTFADVTELDNDKRTFYMGFDASADSQAVGNLAAMMFILTFIRHGYDPIILAGGSTSLIGDPGGKDKERPMQSEETIAHNVAAAEKQLKRIFKGQKFRMVNNLDWTRDVKVLPFLRDIGKHFSMTPLVQRDYVAQRIGEGGAGMSFTEFSYTLLQGFDYLHLYDTYGVTLQLGGSDQWGNCLSGVELIRKARGAETHVVTLNLVINKATGRKFGKSEEGTVWLDETKTSPFKFYQFWITTSDEDVEDYLKIFTELDKETIETILAEHAEDPGLRKAQKRLAQEVTKLVHGGEKTRAVERATGALFGGISYKDLSPEDFEILADELPVVASKEGTPLVDLLVEAGLAASKTEARRFLADSAIYINDSQFSSEKNAVERQDALHGYVVLRRGKNTTALVKLT